MKKNEVRSVNAALRTAPDSAFELVGLAAAFNSLSGDLGGFKEVIAPGAFTRAIREKQDVRCLINHDASRILGRTKSGTLTLTQDSTGLRFLCKLDPTQQAHQDIFKAVKRGDIDQCSFSFALAENGDSFEQVSDGKGGRFVQRTLKDVNLFDVAVVTYPAYPNGTSVQARSSNYSIPRVIADATIPTMKELRKKALRQRCEIFRAAPGFWEIKDDHGVTIRFDPMTFEEHANWTMFRVRQIGKEIDEQLARETERLNIRANIADARRELGL